MTYFSILSLKLNTNYTGEIVVLTDKFGLPQPGGIKIEGVYEINVFKAFGHLEFLTKSKFGIYCIKSMIHKFIDVSSYSFILYLDSDVLVTRQNLNQLLSFWASCGTIQCADNEGWTVKKNVPSTGSEILTDEEKDKYHSYGFCAGVVGVPGGQFAFDFFERWWTINATGKFELDDQGNLTALILRNYLDKFEYIQYMNKNRSIMKDITHYHSNHKVSFWTHVRFLINDNLDANFLNGEWLMCKPCESIKNKWYFKNGTVFVDSPQVIGSVQVCKYGIFIWWSNLNGFELLNKDEDICYRGSSFRGGENCFTLTKL